MTQNAVVDRLLTNGCAMVRVSQQSACGHECESCGLCGERRKLTVAAKNPLGAVPGDLVTVETGTGQVVRAAALVYLLPLAALLLGCISGFALGLSEVAQALMGVAGLLLGSAASILVNRFVRRDRPLEVTIIDVGGHVGPHSEQEA